MFTGIVTPGEIVGADEHGLWVRAPDLTDAEVGASVAIDGVCLTVADRHGDRCRFDVSSETASRTTLGLRSPGDRVNLERPLRAGAELGGHIVQGHVDGVGHVQRADDDGRGGKTVRITCDPSLTRYVVEKGSVAVDGVSLTATRVDEDGFEVALIPHTLEVTTLGEYAAGRRVNIELDVVAKYVEKLGTVASASGPRGAGTERSGPEGVDMPSERAERAR